MTTFRWALLALVTLLGGCGYALVGSGRSLPADVKTVSVSLFENQSQRPGLEQWLTEAVARELSGRGGLEMIPSTSGADAVLTGKIRSYNAWPAVLDEGGRATQYQLTINIDVQLTRGDGTRLLELQGFRLDERYDIPATSADYSDLENLAVAELSGRFAESLVTALFEGF